MLVFDMLDDVVQATLSFQAESALNCAITVEIMFVNLLLSIFLGSVRLRSLVFVILFKSERHIRIIF